MINSLYKKPFFTTGGGGTALPTYVTGQYLTNDGTNLSWAANGMGDLLANGTVPLTANWANPLFGISANNLTATATLGAELITGATALSAWTGAGWTAGATRPHTSGTTALTSTWTPTIGVTYQVQITTTSRTTGNLIINLGAEQVGYIAADVTAATYVVTAITAAAVAIVPSSDYNGTVTVVSIMALTNGAVITPIITPSVIDMTYGYLRFGAQQTSLRFGYQALYNNIGAYCSGFGYQSLYNNAASYCSGFGYQSLYGNTGGSCNGFGNGSLNFNSGANCNGFGSNSLSNNTGANSSGFGHQSLYNNTGANCNGYGNYSLYLNTGANNSQYGYYATAEVNKIQLAKGTWAAVTSGAGTTVSVGRPYRIAAVINGVETELSAVVTGTGVAGAQYDHTNVPLYVGPKTCTARNIYRYKSDKKYYLVGTIADNTTTTYTDTQATATFGTVNASPTNTVSIGTEAKVLATGDYVIGNSSNPLVNLYLGGVYHETPGNAGLDVTVSGMGGNGTDKAGGAITLAGGMGTGTGLGGSIYFKTSPAAVGTGTTENALVTAFAINQNTTLTQTTALTAASGNEAAFTLNYTTNKAAGNDYGLVVNQTDTASPGTSLLADFQVAGVSKANIDNTGAAVFGGADLSSGIIVGSGGGKAIYRVTENYSSLNLASTETAPTSIYAVSTISSGTKTVFGITPTYNQTSTAGGIDLLINRTETAVGSGTQRLIDAQVGGTTRFAVDNKGRIIAAHPLTCTHNTATALFGITIPAGSTAGGAITYTLNVTDNDASDDQIEIGTVQFVGLQDEANWHTNISEVSTQALESGALATTWAIDTATANTLKVTLLANSDLTTPVYTLSYTVTFNNAYTVITY